MLTLVTGTPGAGKTLLTVWEICRAVPGSTVEANGQRVPRRLFSNIKDLLVDHQHIEAADLESWHTWAKPGDVIVYDEVQEVWRPRGLGVKVPPEIAALETHRHMGVDLVLVTQHPMLIDPNIRRLVNQHLHLRRITRGVAMVYEWDHCENPGQIRNVLSHRMFFHKRRMYDLYKSAQAHTKPKARLPAVAYLGLLALVAAAVLVPLTYQRFVAAFDRNANAGQALAADAARRGVPAPFAAASAASPPQFAPAAGDAPPVVPGAGFPVAKSPIAGCAVQGALCKCFSSSGDEMQPEVEACGRAVSRGPVFDLESLPSFATNTLHPSDEEFASEVIRELGTRSVPLLVKQSVATTVTRGPDARRAWGEAEGVGESASSVPGPSVRSGSPPARRAASAAR
jgi:zona occludens toxin